jgi:hypothetical protein
VTLYTHRFLCVPDAHRATALELATTIADAVAPGSADGMWATPLSATGTGAPTHWVSNGMIDAQFASLFGNASATLAAYQAAGGASVTLAQIQALYAAATIRADLNREGGGAEGIAALGLKIIGGAQ